MIDEGTAAPVASLPCEVIDHIGDFAHDFGSLTVDPEKLVEARSDFLALNAPAVEEPSCLQGIHEVRLRVATCNVPILGSVHPVHRRKHESNGAKPGQFPE